MYDVIIIGAGPAGISAGIYAVSRGQKALILEKNQVGGLIRRVSAVTHYAAIVEGETGESFAKRLRKQAENAGVEILKTEVKKVELTGVEKRIYTEKRMLLCEEGNFSEWYITKKTGDSGRNRTGRTRNRNECSKRCNEVSWKTCICDRRCRWSGKRSTVSGGGCRKSNNHPF